MCRQLGRLLAGWEIPRGSLFADIRNGFLLVGLRVLTNLINYNRSDNRVLWQNSRWLLRASFDSLMLGSCFFMAANH